MPAEVLDDMDSMEQEAPVEEGQRPDPPVGVGVSESAAVPQEGGEHTGAEETINLTD